MARITVLSLLVFFGECLGQGIPSCTVGKGYPGFQEVAVQHANRVLGLNPAEYRIQDSHSNSIQSYVYLQQIVDGLPNFDGKIHLSVSPQGSVSVHANTFSSSAMKLPQGFNYANSLSRTRTKLVSQGVRINDARASGPEVSTEQFRARLGWLKGELIWRFEIFLPRWNYFYAIGNKIFLQGGTDQFEAYNVYPLGSESFLLSDPVQVESPADPCSNGWHTSNNVKHHHLRGNNVRIFLMKGPPTENNIARSENKVGNGNTFNFTFPYNIDLTTTPIEYTKLALTQTFFVLNKVHDILNHFGFDEDSGNFQQENFSNLEKGNDQLNVNIYENHLQYPAFSTPPDGRSPTLTIGLRRVRNRTIHTAIETGILIHEYGHGLSQRLTGGPDDSLCISKRESIGLGERWSDTLTYVLRMPSNKTRNFDIGIGMFELFNDTSRIAMYSTNQKTNPINYSHLNRFTEVHRIGTIWATFLYEVYWNLVDKLGFTSDWLGEGVTRQLEFGNTLFLRIMIEAMKIQPCNPTFIQARDAFIKAEAILTNTNHQCEIWNGFAKRGLGYDATDLDGVYANGFNVAPECY